MIKLFLPKMYIKNFQCLNLESLKAKGIKVLICDIDNTLAPHDEAKPTETAVAFIEKAKSMGFKIAVVSNNTKARVSTFCDGLDVFYVNSAKKPLPFGFIKIRKHFGVEKHQIAMLGDQLLTDMFGANFYGVFPVLTSPLVIRDIAITKFNRKLENKVFDALAKKKMLVRGEYYE
ncbi:MAG: YqeG family HAD IIIA-type phosphatase [Erysipelotrichales bacterium]|nr:YqeG family HAD IIIA-type phosphatase [Erysipelotrichales bacterium]